MHLALFICQELTLKFMAQKYLFIAMYFYRNVFLSQCIFIAMYFYRNVFLSQCIFIAILCVKMSHVNKALRNAYSGQTVSFIHLVWGLSMYLSKKKVKNG
jgi:hypothetical protein